MPETVLGQPTMSAGVRSTQSLPTASLVKNLEDDSWTDTHIWYDTKARPIGSFTKNHLGGSTVTEKQLDFSGAVLAANTFHQRLSSDAQVAVRERFEYDSQFRLLKQYHQVNTNPEVLMAEYAYNELGQVTNKKVGNNLQQIDYAYNIRGWVTKVNNPAQLNTDLFGYEVGFTDSSSPLITEGNFNGNITEVSWKSAADNVLKRYSYQYDGYNRLLKGNYQEPETTVPQNEYFSEEMSYDRNGNIMTLQRNSKSMAGSFAEQIDDLVYNYDGNRLTSVNELKQNYMGYPDVSGQPIAYDANGSMKDHQDKGILNIDYNILNLPRTIIYNQLYSVRLYVGGPEEERNVTTRYYYRADGTKLKKAYIRGFKYGIERTTTTEYLDGFQYESITTSQTLQFVPTPEGYYSFQNNQYIYQYKDHLGNVRVSFFSDNGSPSIIEENNYYPIGMAHNNTHISNTYTYQYNGKELQLENGMYDYGARMYMPDIGRWGTVDPLAELYSSYSPYHMVAGNPIMYIDHDGRSYESAIGSPMNDIRAKHPNVYSGWEYIDGVKMGDWNRLPQFNSMIDYLSSSGSAGGGYEVRWKPGGGFTYFSHWTGGGYLPNGYDAGTGHWKTVRPWDLWNSDMARWLVPDRLGATLSVSAGGGVEAGATGGFEIITRGRHAGVYFDPFNTISLGGLIGGSADIDYNLFTSHFSGSVSKLTLDSVVGTEAYIKGGITPGIGINGGYSVSFDPGNPFGGDYPRWHTTTGGVSLGASTPYLGAGLTYSNTRIGIGFDGKFRFASFVTIPKY